MKLKEKISTAKRIILYFILLLPLVFIGFKIVLPMLPSSPMQADAFWANKTNQTQTYDGVIIGDSRVYRGLNPQVLGNNFFNFAFSSAGLSEDYILGAKKLLNPSGKRILIIGVSVNSFTTSALKNEQLSTLKKLSPKDVWIRENLYPFLSYFDYYNLTALKSSFKKEYYYNTYHKNGWMASSKIPIDSTGALASYQQQFASEKFETAAYKNFLKTISQLTKEGFICMGLKMPTTIALSNLEDKFYPEFSTKSKADFKAAGGYWIDANPTQYHSYDGSHLDSLEARKISRYIKGKLYLPHHH
ncbi:MAG: hypothetical protein NTX03_06165 [Bacteroidetes bacterium]|nr:hypothetical protein [Bacteroidota bacterium]